MIIDLFIEPVDEDEDDESCPECEGDDLMRGVYRTEALLIYVIWCTPCGRKLDERQQQL